MQSNQIRVEFEKIDESEIDEFKRLLEEQFDNAQKELYYLIDLREFGKDKMAQEATNMIGDILAEYKGKIGAVAFLYEKKKRKVKTKEIKDISDTFDSDFTAQSYISDQARHGFLSELSVENLMDR